MSSLIYTLDSSPLINQTHIGYIIDSIYQIRKEEGTHAE